MEWNYNLNEAPIDRPIQLLSRDDSPILPQQEFVGTITYGHKNELTKGECLVGDSDYFYRSAMVAWKEMDKSLVMAKEELESLESNFLSNIFRFCNTCFKTIGKNEPHIVAYKNGYPAYFCRDHIHDAEHYLDWFQEFVELK